VRDALAGLLSTLPGGSPVVCADSGLLALKAVRTCQPSVVLVTSSLPNDEIPELVYQIKQAWPGLPCLILSEKIEHQRQALLAGADRVIPGSQPSDYLLTIISQILGQAD
jgi:DNA-binding NarL/FixJ family response regulator